MTKSTEAEIGNYVEWAGVAIAAYGENKRVKKVDLVDLLTELLHWNEQAEGREKTEQLVRDALRNWHDEAGYNPVEDAV